MRILVFSDLHGDQARLGRLLDQPADYYVAAGDLVNWARGLDRMGTLLQRRAGRIGLIPGNHENEREIERLCSEFGLEPLHGRTKDVGNGWTLAALGYSNPTPFGTPGEYSEVELEARLRPFRSLNPERTVVVCHCPPFGTPLDEAAPGKHLGSTAVAAFLAEFAPVHFCCGHIHEAWGRRVRLGRTWAVNTGKEGYLLDLGAEPGNESTGS